MELSAPRKAVGATGVLAVIYGQARRLWNQAKGTFDLKSGVAFRNTIIIALRIENCGVFRMRRALNLSLRAQRSNL